MELCGGSQSAIQLTQRQWSIEITLTPEGETWCVPVHFPVPAENPGAVFRFVLQMKYLKGLSPQEHRTPHLGPSRRTEQNWVRDERGGGLYLTKPFLWPLAFGPVQSVPQRTPPAAIVGLNRFYEGGIPGSGSGGNSRVTFVV